MGAAETGVDARGATPGAARRIEIVRLLGFLGTAVFGLLVLVALLAPVIVPHDPVKQNLDARFVPPFWAHGGSASHLLGTDQLGRDTLSRLIYGSRISLLVGTSTVGISIVVGTTLGLIAGYVAGLRSWLGTIADRAVLAMTEMALAIPGIILAIAVASLFGTNLRNLLIILSLFGWVVFARLVRGIVLSLRTRSFVEAALVLGASHRRIILRHMLPYALPQIVVVGALQVGFMILVESALSYLGLGVQPPTPTWGRMVAEGRDILSESPWVAVFSGLAITITVLSVNFMADLIRSRVAKTTA